MLHTYLSNIANNKQQLLTLPEGIPFFVNSVSFVLSDALRINEFKQEMKELRLVSVSPTVP